MTVKEKYHYPFFTFLTQFCLIIHNIKYRYLTSCIIRWSYLSITVQILQDIGAEHFALDTTGFWGYNKWNLDEIINFTCNLGIQYCIWESAQCEFVICYHNYPLVIHFIQHFECINRCKQLHTRKMQVQNFKNTLQ